MKIGFWELIVIVIVAFVFIGPDQLPVYAKKIGKMLRELKKYTDGHQHRQRCPSDPDVHQRGRDPVRRRAAVQ